MSMKYRLVTAIALSLSALNLFADSWVFYKGRHYKAESNEIDSVVKFHPVDENKLAPALLYKGEKFKIPVDRPYQKQQFPYVEFEIKQVTYPMLEVRNVEVDDTLYNQSLVSRKLEYANFRLEVIRVLKERFEHLKSLYKQEITNSDDLYVYSLFFNKDENKNKNKIKVDKHVLLEIDSYLQALEKEELPLVKFVGLSNQKEILTTLIARDGITGDGRKIAKELGISIPSSVFGDTAYNYARFEQKAKRKNIVMMVPNPFLSDDYVTVPNPQYKGAGYKDWEWMSRISGLEYVSTSYPIDESYYRHKQYPDYKFYWSSKDLFCCDKNNQLVAVESDYHYEDERQVQIAVMLSEFEANKYNVKSEPKEVQQWISYLLNKERGVNIFPNLDRDMMSMTIGAGSVYGEIDKLTKRYNKGEISKTVYLQEVEKSKKKIAGLNKIANKYPSKENRDKAEKYVQQLKMDFANQYEKTDEESKYNCKIHSERVNGLQFMLVTTDRTLKVLKTFSLNNEGKLGITYSLLERK